MGFLTKINIDYNKKFIETILKPETKNISLTKSIIKFENNSDKKIKHKTTILIESNDKKSNQKTSKSIRQFVDIIERIKNIK